MANYKTVSEYNSLIEITKYEIDEASEAGRGHTMLLTKLDKLKANKESAERIEETKKIENEVLGRMKKTDEETIETINFIKKKILNLTLGNERGFKYFYSIEKQKLQRMFIKTGVCTEITNTRMINYLGEEYGVESKIANSLLNVFPELHLSFSPNSPEIYTNESTGMNNYNTFIKPNILKDNENIKEELGEINIEDFDWSKFKYIDLLFRNLFYKDDEMRNHWLNWFAYLIQTLDKTLMTFVFTGPQGSGKGVLFKYVIQYVFGKYAIEIDSKSIHSNFNSLMENKLFVWGNEIKQTDKNKRDGDYNVLKTMITDKDLRIEKKGIDSNIVENFFNTSFSSNDSSPLQVEVTDRRYNFVETGDMLTKAYENIGIGIDDIIDGIEKDKENFIKEVLRIKIDKKKANTVVMNKAKEKVINSTDTLSNNIVKIINDKNFDKLEEMIYENSEENYQTSAMLEKIKNNVNCNFILNEDLIKIYNFCSLNDNISDNAIARMFNSSMIRSEKKRAEINGKKKTIRVINKHKDVYLRNKYEFIIDKVTGLVTGSKEV